MPGPVHWSDLRWMAVSPAHYRHKLLHRSEPTTAMQIGTAVHALVLHGLRNYVVWNGVRRGKEWESFRDTWAYSGSPILNQAEHETAYAIASCVLEHRLASQLLGGHQEIPLNWEAAGRACQGTPDATTGTVLADLKVVHTANPKRFQWHAQDQGWLGQMAWYRAGVWEAYGERPERAYIVAVEAHAPHCVQVYRLTDGALEIGDRIWRGLLETLLVCEKTGHWPGYCDDELPLDVGLDVALSIDGDDFQL